MPLLTFEQLMELVLTVLQWQICLVYLDDIIVFSREVAQHVGCPEGVLDCLLAAGLRLKPKM